MSLSLLDPYDTDVIVKYQIFYLMRIMPPEMPLSISRIIIDMLPKSEDLTSLALTVSGKHPRRLVNLSAWVRESSDFICSRLAHESYPRLLSTIPQENPWRHQAAQVACYDGYLPSGMLNLTKKDVSLDMFVHAKWQDRRLARLASLLDREDKCKLITCNPALIAAVWSEDVRDIESVVLTCVRWDGLLLKHADATVRRQPHIIKAALVSDPMALDCVDDDLVDDFVVFVAKLLAVRRKQSARQYNPCGCAFRGRRLSIPKCIWSVRRRLDLALMVAGAILPLLPAFLQQRMRNVQIAMSRGSYPYVSGSWSACYSEACIEDVHSTIFATRKHVLHLMRRPGRFPIERLPHSLRTDIDIMSFFVANCGGTSMLAYVPTCCLTSAYFWNTLFFDSCYLDQKKHVSCVRYALRKHLPPSYFQKRASPIVNKFWLNYLDIILAEANKESKHYAAVMKESLYVLTTTKIAQWKFWRRVLLEVKTDGKQMKWVINHFIKCRDDTFDARFWRSLCKYCQQPSIQELIRNHKLTNFMHTCGLIEQTYSQSCPRNGYKRPAKVMLSTSPEQEPSLSRAVRPRSN